MTDDQDIIASRVRAIREARGMKGAELARASGMSNGMSIVRVEAGTKVLTSRELEAIARALGVTPEDLRAAGSVSRVLRLLEIHGFILDGNKPAPIDRDSRAVLGFAVKDPPGMFPRRIAVLYAPLVGRAQVTQRLKSLPTPPPDWVLLVSQLPPDRGALEAAMAHKGSPRIMIIEEAELETSILFLTPLAERALRAGDDDRHVLAPPIRFHGEPGPGLRARAFFSRWIKESEPSHLYLIGGPGSGKTTWLQRVAAMLAREHMNAPERCPCPAYFRLRPWWNVTDLRAEIVRRILEDVSYSTHGAVEQALDQGRIILLLDGLDELVGPDPSRLLPAGQALDSFLEIPCRIVLSARTAVLFSRGHPGHPKGGPHARPPMRLAYMDPLTDGDVREHLGTCCPDGGRALAAFVEKHDLRDLARQPWFLDLLVEAPLDRIAAGDPTGGLHALLARRYRLWVEGDAPHLGMLPDELWEWLGYLASEMRRRPGRMCKPSELPPFLAESFWPKGQQSMVGIPAALIRSHRPSTRLLQLTQEGVSFVHVMVERFFFIDWVADQMRAGRASELAGVWLSSEDMSRLVELICDDAIVENLMRWAEDASTEASLRDMATFVLGFTRRDAVLDVLCAVSARAERCSLVGTANFSRVLLGDEAALEAIASRAGAPDASRARAAARGQLLALSRHASMLPPRIRARLDDVTPSCSNEALAAELAAVLSDEAEAATARATAAETLGHLSAPGLHAHLTGVLEQFSAKGPLERGPDHVRLAMAVRAALELLPPE